MANDGYRGFGIGIEVDTGDSTRATKDLAKQMRALEREMDRADRAAGQYEKQQEQLNRAYKAGEISQKAYQTGMNRVEQNYKRATAGAKKYEEQLKKISRAKDGLQGRLTGKAEDLAARAGLGGLGLSGGALLAGAGAGAVAIGGKVAFAKASDLVQYNREMERQGELLGVSGQRLQGITFALGRLAGASSEQAIDGLNDLRERLAEGYLDPTSEVGRQLNAMGIAAGKLKDADIGTMLEGVIGGLSKLSSADRMFRSRAAFGDSVTELLQNAIGDKDKFNSLVRKGESQALSTKSVEQFTSAMNTLKDSMIPLQRRVARGIENLAEVMDTLTSWLRDENLDKNVLQLNEAKDLFKNAGIQLEGTQMAKFDRMLASFMGTGGWVENPTTGTGRFNNLMDTLSGAASFVLPSYMGTGMRGANMFRGEGDPSAQLRLIRQLDQRYGTGEVSAMMDKELAAKAKELKDRFDALSDSTKRASDEQKKSSKPQLTVDQQKLVDERKLFMKSFNEQGRRDEIENMIRNKFRGEAPERIEMRIRMAMEWAEKSVKALELFGQGGLDRLFHKQVEFNTKQLANLDRQIAAEKEKERKQKILNKGRSLLSSLGAGPKDKLDMIMERYAKQMEALEGQNLRQGGFSGGIAGEGREYEMLAQRKAERDDRRVEQALDRERNRKLDNLKAATVRAIKEQTKKMIESTRGFAI